MKNHFPNFIKATNWPSGSLEIKSTELQIEKCFGGEGLQETTPKIRGSQSLTPSFQGNQEAHGQIDGKSNNDIPTIQGYEDTKHVGATRLSYQ